jgi:hypothetical protein|tara:strand:- start:992 stop:1336 length:345 start_codon:yes stop_codon:yes gene_type:complete
MDMNKKETYFIDIDGTILKYRKFNSYYNKEAEVIPSSLKFIEEKYNGGHMIVLTTARPESMLPHTVKELINNKIPFHKIISGIERGPRYLINDLDPKKEDKRAIAINVKRDEGI